MMVVPSIGDERGGCSSIDCTYRPFILSPTFAMVCYYIGLTVSSVSYYDDEADDDSLLSMYRAIV